jgi:hypothetical protein
VRNQLKHAMVLENLAKCYQLNGQIEFAINIQTKAILLISQLFGEDHENCVTSKNTLYELKKAHTEKIVKAARQKQIDEETAKERQRLNWLEDDMYASKSANGHGNKVGGGKKKPKKNNKKK